MSDLPSIVVIGSAHLDVIASADRVPSLGESVLGHTLSVQPGGKASNQAAQVALNGQPAILLGRAGADHFGTDLLARLAAKGVDVSLVARDPDSPTGISPIFTGAGGEYASIIVPGAASRLTEADVDAAAPALATSAAVMLQLEIPTAPSARAARLGRAGGALICLNASPLAHDLAVRAADLMPLTDLLIVNQREASAIAGDADDAQPAARVALALRSRFSLSTVVVTLGARGAVLANNEGVIEIPAFPVTVVDTIGSGDAFAAVLISELTRGVHPRDALTHAAAAGALAASRPGAFNALASRTERLVFLNSQPQASSLKPQVPSP